ncbi:dnaJ protein homolog 1-like [Dermacentor andersoni]|uniref:dnaJ protein homolog 1-like n=1 Tax=Dermacentor andersoni TaxID=34620 RepID=UPI003B3B76A3
MSGATERHQAPTIYSDVHVSLEEVYNGCTKYITITRMVTGPDCHTPMPEAKVFEVVVKPGWKEGTKIRFHREGDRLPNSIPADVVFVIRDKPHPQFKRDGADVRYVAKITFKEARVTFLSLRVFAAVVAFRIKSKGDKIEVGRGRVAALRSLFSSACLRTSQLYTLRNACPLVSFITDSQALRGTVLEVPTITHGTIFVPLTDIVTPTTVNRIRGQGLRRSDDPSTRGDLILSFDIEYPCQMTDAALKLLWNTIALLI